MSLSAAVIRELMCAGLEGEALLSACERIEDSAPAKAAPTTARQARNKRYYDRKASEKRLKASEQDVSDGGAVIADKEIPPHPPKKLIPPTKENPPKGGQKKKGSRLTEDWVLPDDWQRDAIVAGLPRNLIEREAEKMRDWSLSSPTGAKLNWRATWRNWLKGAVDKLPSNRGSPNKPLSASQLAKQLSEGTPDDSRQQNETQDYLRIASPVSASGRW